MTKATSYHLQQKRAATIARILDTAREIMRSDGVAALSMQEIARRMQMRAPSLYNYFASKTEIYDTLFQLGFQKFDEHIQQLALTGEHWQADLSKIMEGYLVYALQNPELYQICFERPVPGFEPSSQSMKLSIGILQSYYAYVKNWIPLINTDLNEQQLSDLMIAIMHGLTALHLANQPELPLGEGRFGSLIPSVVDILDKSLSKIK